MTERAERVLSYVPLSKDLSISSKHLCQRTDLSYREVRRALEEMRLDGVLVVNNGKGFWVADPEADLDEIEHYYWVSVKFAASIFRRLKPIRKLLIQQGRLTKGGRWIRHEHT